MNLTNTISNQYLFFIKRFIPESESKTSVGIDIGKNSCKMIELRRRDNIYQLINWAVEPIFNADIESSLKNTLNKLTIPNHSPNTAVFGKGTLIRYIEMPRMTLEEVKKSVAVEADKYFPFSQEEIYIDCFILEPGNRDKMPVMVAASKKKLIDERIALLNKLGLHADFIGLNSIAIANILNVLGLQELEETQQKGQEADLKTVAILDMGEMESNLTILINNLPRFTRDIYIGGYDFSKSISHALGISLEETEKLKFEVPEDKTADVLKASDASISNLISELRMSFDYFVTEKNISVSKLLLTGGASKFKGLVETFENAFEIKVKRWDPIESLHLAPQISKEEIHKDADKLAVALGLALYQ